MNAYQKHKKSDGQRKILVNYIDLGNMYRVTVI